MLIITSGYSRATRTRVQECQELPKRRPEPLDIRCDGVDVFTDDKSPPGLVDIRINWDLSLFLSFLFFHLIWETAAKQQQHHIVYI